MLQRPPEWESASCREAHTPKGRGALCSRERMMARDSATYLRFPGRTAPGATVRTPRLPAPYALSRRTTKKMTRVSALCSPAPRTRRSLPQMTWPPAAGPGRLCNRRRSAAFLPPSHFGRRTVKKIMRKKDPNSIRTPNSTRNYHFFVHF